MSDNINISGINFRDLPEDFNIDSAKDVLGEKGAEKLNKTLENFNIKDGLNRDEAEQIIVAINIDGNDEITNEEIRSFIDDNTDNLSDIYDVETRIADILNSVTMASKDALGLNESEDDVVQETDDTGETDETDATEENKQAQAVDRNGETDDKSDAAAFKATVQKWGSTASDGNKYANDCLDHIMRNYYPDITPYSEEWRNKETEIMNANQHIYGDENGNGARATVGGTGRHSAVLYIDDEITLPGLENKTASQASDVQQDEEPVQESGTPSDEGTATPEPLNAAGKISEGATVDKSKTETFEEDGIKIDTYVDADGNIVGKKQYKDDELMWESSITTGEDNTIIETRTRTQSGQIEQIIYNENNNAIKQNTQNTDGTTTSTVFKYENGIKIGDITHFDAEGNVTGTGHIAYAEDGSWVENTEYTSGEYANSEVSTTFDKFGMTTSKTIKNENENVKNVNITDYKNGSPKITTYYENDVMVGKCEYEIRTDGSHIETATKADGTKKTVTEYDANGNEVSRIQSEYTEGCKQLSQTEWQGDTLTKTTNWKYDETSGNLLQETETEYQDDGETAKSITITGYDQFTGAPSDACTVIFDEQGNPVEATGKTELLPQELQDKLAGIGSNDDTGTQTDEIAEMRSDIATARAQALHAAMDRAGTDEEVVRDILKNTVGQDLVNVMDEYEKMYNTSLEDAIKGDFSWISGESELLAYLNMAKNYAASAPQEEITLEKVHAAQLQAFKAATTNRLGTDERVLFDIFQNMNDTELKSFLEYCKSQKVNVKTTVINETSFETQKSLIQRIETLEGTQPKPKIEIDTNNTQERSEAQIRADIATARAQALHAAMDRAGTDEAVVRNILRNTIGQDLVDVINEYERLFDSSLEDAIKGDFSFISGESELLGYLNMAKNYASNAQREEVSEEKLHQAQLQAFKAATTNRLGTDEKIIYQMFQNGSMTKDDIIALNEALKKENSSIKNVFLSEFSGEVLNELLRLLKKLDIKEETNNIPGNIPHATAI